MKTYKQLIFDADDTLFDFQIAEKIALEMTLKAFEVEYNDQIYQLYKGISKRLWNNLELGLVTQEVLKYQRFKELFEMVGIERNVNRVADRYLENLSEQGILFEGALELVRELSVHYDLYILTNGINAVQKGRFQHSPIMSFIKGIIISEEAGVNKPSEGIFKYFDEKFGPFNKPDLLMIGDSLTSDIQGGINYGIDTCWYNPNGEVSECLVPTYEIKLLEALYDLLLQSNATK